VRRPTGLAALLLSLPMSSTATDPARHAAEAFERAFVAACDRRTNVDLYRAHAPDGVTPRPANVVQQHLAGAFPGGAVATTAQIDDAMRNLAANLLDDLVAARSGRIHVMMFKPFEAWFEDGHLHYCLRAGARAENEVQVEGPQRKRGILG
jgi:hypothetical protein